MARVIRVQLRWEGRDARGRPARVRSILMIPRSAPFASRLSLSLADWRLPLIAGAGLLPAFAIGAIVLLQVGRLSRTGQEALVSHAVGMLWSPFLSLLAVVIGFVSVARLMRPYAFRAALAMELCPACGYSLTATTPESDGCTVCPECGAAWKLPRPSPN
jgi:hypothetical protein